MRGGGKVTMISHGVEISIAGGVGEMVRNQLLGAFFIFFIFYILYSLVRYKNSHAVLAMA